ncbi:MAG: uroporphyrinogen decarboxylase family protein [Planctomycetia bacterium]
MAGNISPVDVLLNGTPKSIQTALEECYHEVGPRYIIAAGCEFPRTTPLENVTALTQFATRN